MELDGVQTLMWRLRRHSLVPEPAAASEPAADPEPGPVSEQRDALTAEVVDRVVALRAWPERLAEQSIRIRRAVLATATHRGDGTKQGGGSCLAEAQASGAVIRSYALRGGSYFFTPQTGANLLSVRTTTKGWESARFQRQGAFVIDDWQPFREAVHEACADGPRTRAEISAHVLKNPAFRGLETGLGGAGSDSLYKPLHWWGDICFGPPRDGIATFRWLDDDPAWPGLPDVDVAGPRAIADYVHSYGPVTGDNLHYWLSDGLSVPKARVRQWLAALGDDLVEVDVEFAGSGGGTSVVAAYVLASDLDDIRASVPQESVLLLPGVDPWVMGPGTADTRIISAHPRALATRGSNMIVHNGVITGTWRFDGDEIRTQWFEEAGPVPQALLDEQVRAVESGSRSASAC